jgi:CSLREA domain-containing protein
MGRRAGLLLVVMTAGLVKMTTPAWAATFTVNSTADTGDSIPDGACSSTCTLREAMQEASANNNDPRVDVINSSIRAATSTAT